ncbi:MAG: hypothetical protein L6R42_007275 [Xanthoria sp. 1 TBL-2021]|nr:MAG: hypothetical protein L6R42_007275 [Xanthoria sp. 1 TBL-2021]
MGGKAKYQMVTTQKAADAQRKRERRAAQRLSWWLLHTPCDAESTAHRQDPKTNLDHNRRSTNSAYANSSEDNVKSWVQRLIDDVHNESPPKSTRSKLSYVGFHSVKRLELQAEASQSQATYSCGSSDRSSDPQAYCREGLTILVQASLLLQNGKLFANSETSSVVTSSAFQDISEDINSQTIELLKFGLKQMLEGFDLNTRYRIMRHHVGWESAIYDGDFLETWVRSEMEQALRTLTAYSHEEAPTMLDMAERYGEGFLNQR